MEAFDKKAKEYLSFLNNDYVSSALSIILIVYATMAAPKLPESIARLFDYTAVKLLLFFLIAYISGKNPTVAIIAAVAVLVSLMTLSKYKAGKEMMEVIKNEVATPPAVIPMPQIPTDAITAVPTSATPPEMPLPELVPEIPPMTELAPEKKQIPAEIIPEIQSGPEKITPEVLSEIAEKIPSPEELSRIAAKSCRKASHSCRMAAKSCGGNKSEMKQFRQPRGYDSVSNAFAPL